MRILVVPIFNYPRNLNADSVFHVVDSWVRELVRQHEDLAVHRLLPELDIPDKTLGWQAAGKVKPHPRIHDIRVPMFTHYDVEETHIDPAFFRKFHSIMGDLAVDAVICTSSAKLLGVFNTLTAAGGSRHRPVFVGWDLLLRGMGTGEVQGVTDGELLMQATGQAMADRVWFESPVAERMSMEVARKFVAFAQAKKIAANKDMAYPGFEAMPVLPMEYRFKEFTVVVRGRVTSSKHIDEILKVYNRRHAAGHDIRILFTTGDMKNKLDPTVQKQLESNSSIDYRQCANKFESVTLMRKAHAFILWSSHELFCVSLWEMLGAGLIGAIKRASWHKGLLPDDYPYVFDNATEAYAMLAEIQENYDEVSRKLAWVRDWVVERYSVENAVCAASNGLLALIRDNTVEPRSWVVDMMRSSRKKEFALEEAFDYIAARSEMGDSVVKDRNPARVFTAVGPRELTAALKEAGFVEDLTLPLPVFRRV